MKIITSFWFTAGMYPVGVVVSKNDQDQMKMHIGTGLGFTESQDEEMIALVGAKLTQEKVQELHALFNTDTNKFNIDVYKHQKAVIAAKDNEIENLKKIIGESNKKVAGMIKRLKLHEQEI